MKGIESYKQVINKTLENEDLFFTIVDEDEDRERFYHFFVNPIPYCEESEGNLRLWAFEGRKVFKIFWLLRRKADRY